MTTIHSANARVTRAMVLGVSVAMLASSPTPRAQTDIARMSGAGRDISMTVIADGVYQFTTMRDSYVRQLNSVVIVNDSDVLVFDTGTRPSSARIVLAEIRKLTDKPVRYVVNSHWHPDHWLGNSVYADAFPALEVIATRGTREFMQNTSVEWAPRFRAELKGMQDALRQDTNASKQAENDVRDYGSLVDETSAARFVYPTIAYRDQLTMSHGGREYRFLSVTGDAEATTVLYLPKEKILITGDAVSYPVPYVSPPPSLHLASLKALAQLDVDVIIPGHGPAFRDKTFLNLEIELLESVISGVHDAMQRGMLTLDQVQAAVTVDALRERFAHGDEDLNARFRARVKALVKIAIREGRGGQDLP